MLVWQRLLEAVERHGKAAMATIVETRGSSPREAGARIVVLPDASFFGTIGGGTLEWHAVAALQAMLERPATASLQKRSMALGPELGQCCGGRVDLVYELFDASDASELRQLADAERAGRFEATSTLADGRHLARRIGPADLVAGAVTLDDGLVREGFGETRRPLILFGAGHVGRALVLALAPLPFRIDWVDPRPEAFPGHMPGNARAILSSDPAEILDRAAEDSFVLVMTHSHALDLAVVHAALAERDFPYVGLIGSATKRARFRSRLAEAGVGSDRIARLVCPIGIGGIHSKIPAVIAASVAADLLIRDEAVHNELARPLHSEISGTPSVARGRLR